jgi:hypothetical protein
MRAIGVLAAFIAFLCVGVVFVLQDRDTKRDEYKETCVAIKGKPVYNGRNWECMK